MCGRAGLMFNNKVVDFFLCRTTAENDGSNGAEEKASSAVTDKTVSLSVDNGKDTSNVIHRRRVTDRLDSKEITVNVEGESKDDENIFHPTYSTLATQIKKIAPSVNILDPQIIISPEQEPSYTSLKRKGTLTTNVPQFKVVQYVGSRKLSIMPEIEQADILNLEGEECSEGDIDEAIKKIPLPMEKRRQRRNTLMILPKKVPWCKKLLNYVKRFYARIQEYELWNEHLKTIEGRFGVAVVSYFLFIRWLLIMNCVILSLNLVFLVFPQLTAPPIKHEHLSEIISPVKNSRIPRKDEKFVDMYQNTIYTETSLVFENELQYDGFKSRINRSAAVSTIVAYCRKKYHDEFYKMKYSGFYATIQSFLEGTGWLEPTLLFLGFYVDENVYFFGVSYHVPLAFLWVFIISFITCFIMMIRYSSFGMQEAFFSEHNIVSFTNELFSAWNYCIRTPKAASLCHHSFVVELKSELAEARRRKELKERSTAIWIQIFVARLVVNTLVLFWIAGCYMLIYEAALYQLSQQENKQLRQAGFRTLWIQYLPSLTVTAISSISPMFFNFLVSFEKYHGQKEVNVSLTRNVFLSLSSIFVLISTLHREVSCTPKDICGAGIGPDCKAPRCWETYVGQQLYKLNLTQLFVIVAAFILFDVPREFLVKLNCKYLKFITRASFFLPTEVLIPVYSQTILWLGVFYSPLVPVITVIKLIVLFYVKKTKVLKFSQPSQVHYKASRFNATFINILLLSFFVVLIVHFYTLQHIRPSLGCTPFSYYDSMLHALKEAFQFLPFDIVFFFMFILSGWFFIPSSIILCTVIYYYRKYLAFLMKMEDDLKLELAVLGQDKQFILQRIEDLAKKQD